MTQTLPYTDRAARYARYRWDYAAQAIDAIFSITGIGLTSCAADVGSGTGILTRHLVDRVRSVYAVEPDVSMRWWAEQALANAPTFNSVAGSAQTTTLPDRSVDLIVVGQALHWFDPLPSRQEFLRILIPGGWLAVLWNQGTDAALAQALSALCTPENGWDTSIPNQRREVKPFDFYFGHAAYLQREFAAVKRETWEEFFGALCSDSHAPAETQPSFERLRNAAWQVFRAHSEDGFITVRYRTHLVLGVIRRQTHGQE
jgi:SAM-dependent methyltransferase